MSEERKFKDQSTAKKAATAAAMEMGDEEHVYVVKRDSFFVVVNNPLRGERPTYVTNGRGARAGY